MKNITEAATWPEKTRETAELHPDNAKIKKDIAAKYGKEALTRSWVKTCEALNSINETIAARQSDMIPEFQYDEVLAMNDKLADKLRDAGTFVVRGVVSQEHANAWFKDLQEYVDTNKDIVTGWPEETPYILKLHWSRAQIEARTHPRQMALQRVLNSLWHDDEDPEQKFIEPLAYADACRIRPPGVPFPGLGPHIDTGSTCRWDEPQYHKVYEKIWAGKPEEWDPYDLTIRKRADPRYHAGLPHSKVLRNFQGWTALTRAGAGEGSLLVHPELRYTMAYVLLRPFFQPPINNADIMDGKKWTLDLEDLWFPGVWRWTPQELSAGAFPHLQLERCMVNIPTMNPGDTVWWHTDVCHAVEVEHSGKNISSVVYVPATPTTDINLAYIREQYKDMVAGVSPPDYRGGPCEKAFKGYPGLTCVLNGAEGHRAIGATA